jgi:hypothetical protein
MAATVQGAYFFRNRVRMYIGMSNDFYRPNKISSCAPGLIYNIELDKLFVADGNIVYGTHETLKFVERTLIDFILVNQSYLASFTLIG